MATILERPARRRRTSEIDADVLADLCKSLDKCKDGQMVLVDESAFENRNKASAAAQRTKRFLDDSGYTVRTHTVQDADGNWFAAVSPKS